MPNFEEICEVRAAGSSYKDWLSVEVHWGLEDRRTFSLQLAEPTKPGGGFAGLKLKPWDDVDIILAGQPAIQGGKVVSRQTAYDANRRAVQVDGFSKSGDIGRTSAKIEGGQYRNYTYTAIATKLLEPLGLKFKMENPPEGADEKFKNVIIFQGETVGDVLHRLARQRGFWLSVSPDGTLLGGLPKGEGSATLVEGVNILSANCRITDEAAGGSLDFVSQRPGSDDEFGSAVSQVKVSGSIDGIDQARKWIEKTEEPLTKKEAETRRDMSIRQMLAGILVARITHRGWYRPGSQSLWAPGDHATVKSPMLFWTGDTPVDLRVWEVVCRQDVPGGTTTTVTLVSEAAFQQQYPDGKAPNPLQQGG